MTAVALNVTQSVKPWAAESPYACVEGDQLNFSFNIAYASSVANDANLACLLHLEGEDVSSANLTGSVTATGTDNNIISKTTTGLVRGTYVLSVYGTVDGLVRCAGKVMLKVQLKGAKQ